MVIWHDDHMRYSINKVKYKPLWSFSIACIMDNKFISRDTLQKYKARKNKPSSQRETCLAKQREITQQKRARENANAKKREAHDARDKEQKRVKLATETDEQREKCLSYYHERRKYLKNIQNTMAQDLNSQQKNLQQKYQDSSADDAEGDGAEDDGTEDGADTHTDAGVLVMMSQQQRKRKSVQDTFQPNKRIVLTHAQKR
ncbi:uncharacterized protein OCT59_025054 [Rhizophagus irregularis]|uniref:uncharacterized protein n=1 Tax=Rhizophagus irregularis TaxID=588596 RepID=UPI003328CDEB|nr:hypothetical protein OCT59_025054 [Rhizophagus irregularis]